jgi:hypothetical protein
MFLYPAQSVPMDVSWGMRLWGLRKYPMTEAVTLSRNMIKAVYDVAKKSLSQNDA